MAAKKKARAKTKPAKRKVVARKKVARKAASSKVAPAPGKKAAARKKPAARAGKPKAPPKVAAPAAKPARPKPRPKAPARAARPSAPTPKPVAPAPIPPGAERVGVVTHYFSHLQVAVVQLESGSLREGDVVHIKGHTTDFTQPVESMEVEHVHVSEAYPGQSLGLRVKEHAREHDVVYKVKG